jgi:hypothetical protein
MEARELSMSNAREIGRTSSEGGRLRNDEAPAEPIRLRALAHANPRRPTTGSARFDRFDLLRIDRATSGTMRDVRDLDVSQAIELTEFAKGDQTLSQQPIPLQDRWLASPDQTLPFLSQMDILVVGMGPKRMATADVRMRNRSNSGRSLTLANRIDGFSRSHSLGRTQSMTAIGR